MQNLLIEEVSCQMIKQMPAQRDDAIIFTPPQKKCIAKGWWCHTSHGHDNQAKVSNMQIISEKMVISMLQRWCVHFESTVCSRNRFTGAWWKPIGVSLFHGCPWRSFQNENWRPMCKAHKTDQIYNWGSKEDGQKLHTASSKGRIWNCIADDAPVGWRSTRSNYSASQRDQAVATDQTRRC